MPRRPPISEDPEQDNFSDALKRCGYGDNKTIYRAAMAVKTLFSALGLTNDQARDTLDVMTTGGLLEFLSLGEVTWGPFNYGNVRVGDFVRVQEDAYDSETGTEHNGRVGVLVNISGRRGTVRYLGLSRVSDMRHPIDKLQSLR